MKWLKQFWQHLTQDIQFGGLVDEVQNRAD